MRQSYSKPKVGRFLRHGVSVNTLYTNVLETLIMLYINFEYAMIFFYSVQHKLHK